MRKVLGCTEDNCDSWFNTEALLLLLETIIPHQNFAKSFRNEQMSMWKEPKKKSEMSWKNRMDVLKKVKRNRITYQMKMNN